MPRPLSPELNVVVAQLPSNARPEPPPELTPRERQLWKDITDSMPSHWFTPACQPLLRVLIVHIVNSEYLAAALREIWAAPAPTNSERFVALNQMLALSGKIIAGISQKLRLTPHSRTSAAAADFARRNVPTSRPWEED
jgi:hypothetical protein